MPPDNNSDQKELNFYRQTVKYSTPIILYIGADKYYQLYHYAPRAYYTTTLWNTFHTTAIQTQKSVFQFRNLVSFSGVQQNSGYIRFWLNLQKCQTQLAVISEKLYYLKDLQILKMKPLPKPSPQQLRIAVQQMQIFARTNLPSIEQVGYILRDKGLQNLRPYYFNNVTPYAQMHINSNFGNIAKIDELTRFYNQNRHILEGKVSELYKDRSLLRATSTRIIQTLANTKNIMKRNPKETVASGYATYKTVETFGVEGTKKIVQSSGARVIAHGTKAAPYIGGAILIFALPMVKSKIQAINKRDIEKQKAHWSLVVEDGLAGPYGVVSDEVKKMRQMRKLKDSIANDLFKEQNFKQTPAIEETHCFVDYGHFLKDEKTEDIFQKLLDD